MLDRTAAVLLALIALPSGCARISESGDATDASPPVDDAPIDKTPPPATDAGVDTDPRVLQQLPGDPSGPAPPAGRWVPMLGPRGTAGARVESGGTRLYGGSVIFRSVDGATPRPFVEADMFASSSLLEAPRMVPSVTAAGEFLLVRPAGLFSARRDETAWTRVPCPASGCAGVQQTGSGSFVKVDAIGPPGSITHLLMRSVDRGATWTSTALPAATSSPCTLAPTVGARLLISCVDSLYLSEDEGKSWNTCTLAPSALTHRLTDTSVVAVAKQAIHVSPDCKSWATSWSSDVWLEDVFARGSRLFVAIFGTASPRSMLRSRDGGRTWSRVSVPVPVPAPVAGSWPLVSLGEGARVFAWNDRSEDDGDTWVPDLGAPTYTRGITVQRNKAEGPEGDLWTGTGLRSIDNGKTWLPPASAGYGPEVVDESIGVVFGRKLNDPSNPAFRTLDRGATWLPIVDQALALRAGGGLVVLGTRKVSSNINGLMTSRDGGATWSAATPPFRIDERGLAISTFGVLFVISGQGDDSGGISVDDGKTWTLFPTPPKLNYRFQTGTVEDDPAYQEPARLAVAPSGELFAWASDAIFRSKDSGRTWAKQASAGLPSKYAWVRWWAPNGPQGTFFAQTVEPRSDGLWLPAIYASIDGGASFHPYSEGLDPRTLDSVTYDLTGRAVADTNAGLYRYEPK